MSCDANANIMRVLSKKVKSYREECGISQEAFAEDAELSARAVSSIELGKSDPHISTLEKIAKGMGTHPALLLLEDDILPEFPETGPSSGEMPASMARSPIPERKTIRRENLALCMLIIKKAKVGRNSVPVYGIKAHVYREGRWFQKYKQFLPMHDRGEVRDFVNRLNEEKVHIDHLADLVEDFLNS